ncbi:MAG: hypothetical protein ABSH41_26195 [Syntrophobacteraceae bacterium]
MVYEYEQGVVREPVEEFKSHHWDNYIMRKFGRALQLQAIPAIIAPSVCRDYRKKIEDAQEEAALTLVRVVECDDFKDGVKI